MIPIHILTFGYPLNGAILSQFNSIYEANFIYDKKMIFIPLFIDFFVIFLSLLSLLVFFVL